MGHTHALIGAAAGAGLALALHQHGAMAALMAAAGAGAALLPDVDHPRGTLRQRAGLVGDLALGWLPHRGFTHTLLALALLALALVFAGGHGLRVEIAAAAFAAYFSHLVADALTVRGVPLLWPIYRRHIVLLGIHTGGVVEWVISMVCGAGLVALLWRAFLLPTL